MNALFRRLGLFCAGSCVHETAETSSAIVNRQVVAVLHDEQQHYDVCGEHIIEQQQLQQSSLPELASVQVLSDSEIAQQVLLVLLQQPSVLKNTQVVCKLLCTSKGLQAALAEFGHGQVPVEFSPGTRLLQAEEEQEQVILFLPWLHKHAALAHHLSVDFSNWEAEDMFRRQAPAALQHAAAAQSHRPGRHNSLQLRSFSWGGGSCGGAALLRSLSGNSLTQLQWVLAPHCAVASALATLSSLRTLDVSMPGNERWISHAVLDVLQPLSRLHVLTQLLVGCVRPAQLQWLPQQLLELQLGRFQQPQAGDAYKYLQADMPAAAYGNTICLPQLTALTSLQECDAFVPSTVAVGCHDQLPPQLKVLQVFSVSSLQPLLQLQQLEELRIQSSIAPLTLGQLEQLSSNSSLQQLQLTLFGQPHVIDQAAEGTMDCNLVPLDSLTISLAETVTSRPCLPRLLVRQMKQLTSLTHLQIQGVMQSAAGQGLLQHSPGVFKEISTGQVAGLLTSLSGLRRLQLRGCQLQQPERSGLAAVHISTTISVEKLMQAIAALQGLRDVSLELHHTVVYDSAMTYLATATQLTRLHLRSAGLTAENVEALKAGLAGRPGRCRWWTFVPTTGKDGTSLLEAAYTEDST